MYVAKVFTAYATDDIGVNYSCSFCQKQSHATVLALAHSPLTHPDVQAEVVARGRLVVAVRRGHPLLRTPARERKLKLSDFPQTAAKAFHGVENCERHPILEKWKVVPKATAVIFDNYDVCVRCLKDSDAWALLPEWVYAREREGLAVAADPGDAAPVSVTAMWPKNRPPIRALSELVDESRRILGAGASSKVVIKES